jgi:hypothetical protein
MIVKNQRVKKSKKKILEHFKVGNQIAKHSWNVAPLPLIFQNDL